MVGWKASLKDLKERRTSSRAVASCDSSTCTTFWALSAARACTCWRAVRAVMLLMARLAATSTPVNMTIASKETSRATERLELDDVSLAMGIPCSRSVR